MVNVMVNAYRHCSTKDASGVFGHLSHAVLRISQCDSVISLEMKFSMGMSPQVARHKGCKNKPI